MNSVYRVVVNESKLASGQPALQVRVSSGTLRADVLSIDSLSVAVGQAIEKLVTDGQPVTRRNRKKITIEVDNAETNSEVSEVVE